MWDGQNCQYANHGKRDRENVSYSNFRRKFTGKFWKSCFIIILYVCCMSPIVIGSIVEICIWNMKKWLYDVCKELIRDKSEE